MIIILIFAECFGWYLLAMAKWRNSLSTHLTPLLLLHTHYYLRDASAAHGASKTTVWQDLGLSVWKQT